MNYNETVEYIHSLKKFHKKATLDEMRAVMDKLGCDYNNLKFIHVAGTNGKGSVSNMLANIALNEGLKVGLFTSPYIICFRERIKVNGQMIPEDALVRLSQRIIEAGIDIKEFEFITALALLYFEECGCDLVVLECGMGGRDDSTNIISSPLASVITHIGLDHTAILGNTVAEIAAQKFGIAKKNCPLIIAPNQPNEALEVLNREAVICDADSIKILKSDFTGSSFIYGGTEFRINMAGEFQIDNAVCAIETAKCVGLGIDSIKKGIAETKVPARVEVISENPAVIIDGAHNPDGANALKNVVKNIKGEKTAVVAMVNDKDIENVLNILLPEFDNIICTEIADNPRSLSAEELCGVAKKYKKNISVAKRSSSAVEKALALNTSVVIFGSLYLASEVRRLFKK